MNNRVKRQDLEKLLFLDCETVRRNNVLDINSKEYDLYAWKLRDKETSKLPPSDEVLRHYELSGALDPVFNKIVCITIGFIKGDILYLKSLLGEQKDIITEFYNIVNSTGFIPCGHNIISFDMPTIRLKAFESSVDLNLLNERVTDSEQKPWILSENMFDTMTITKGTYYYNLSLDAMCFLGGVDTPKDGISGADVSRVYYEGGIKEISEYCKKDVKAVAELFCNLQGKKGFIKNVVDRTEIKMIEQPLPVKLFNLKQLTLETLGELKDIVKKKKPTKKDKEIILEILKASLSDINQDFGKVKNEIDVNKIIEQLKTIIG
jgi:predicted PolB exonuclease-like 3'-5' exonuclease